MIKLTFRQEEVDHFREIFSMNEAKFHESEIKDPEGLWQREPRSGRAAN